MMKNTNTTSTEIHALTRAEIGRQIAHHLERRRQIVDERAALYRSTVKTPPHPAIDDDERAAREHAKKLLNGNAPESLSSPPEISRDRELLREQRGIEIALKILSSDAVAATAAEAVAWAETNGPAWQQVCREITLTAIRFSALEHRATALLDQCVDVAAVRLPMINIIGSRSLSEISVGELSERALTEGVITQAEKRKAENV